MKPNDKIIAEACRVEYTEKTGELFIVFRVTDEKYKQYLKKHWVDDIDFRLVDKLLVREDE